jgi:hypothetical protein
VKAGTLAVLGEGDCAKRSAVSAKRAEGIRGASPLLRRQSRSNQF